MPRKQHGGIMDMIKDYANKATEAAKGGLDAAKSAAGMEDDEEKKRKQRATERARMHAAHATAPTPVGPVPSSAPAPVTQLGGRKRRRGGRKGGRKGGRRTRKAGMCGVCGGGRKGGRKTKRKRGGKKTHKKRKGRSRSGLGTVKRMVERYF